MADLTPSRLSTSVRAKLRAVIGFFAWLLPFGVPVLISLNANFHANDSQRRLSTDEVLVTNPVESLNSAPQPVSVSIHRGSEEIENLRLAQGKFENTGFQSIRPTDFVKPLCLSVSDHWYIISIISHGNRADDEPRIIWHSDGPSRQCAEPYLLNKGDSVSFTVYAANNDKTITPSANPTVNLTARIIDLPQLDKSPSTLDEMNKMGPIYVSIWGPGVPLLITTFVAFMLTGCRLLLSARINSRVWITAFIIVTLSVIFMCASEAITTYVFGTSPLFHVPVDNWINLPPVVAAGAALLGLFIWGRANRNQQQPAPDTDAKHSA